MALAMAAQGTHVVLVACPVDQLTARVARIESVGGRATALPADLADAARHISCSARSSSAACRTQLREVSAVQPILSASDPMAAHCEVCLP